MKIDDVNPDLHRVGGLLALQHSVPVAMKTVQSPKLSRKTAASNGDELASATSRQRKLPAVTKNAENLAGDAERSGVQSVENGLQLLLALANSRRPMKITDLAASVGVAPGKAHRYLVSFQRAGFVRQDEDSGLYALGPVATEFSLSCLATIEPVAIATQEAERLCLETAQTVAVSVWGSFGPTVVRWEQPARPTMVNMGLGSVFPIYRSATGRIFACWLQDSLLQEVLRASGQELPDCQGLAENLEQIRRRGLARAEGDFMDGMSAFAAPVFSDRGRLVAVMTLLGYRGGFDSRWNGPLAQALKDAAQRTSQALGFRG